MQSLHRIYRYGMKPNRFGDHHVRIDLIHTEAERHIVKQLTRKWNQHNELVKKMTDVIKQYGLNHVEMAQHLTRKMGIERVEVSGKNFRAVQADNDPFAGLFTVPKIAVELGRYGVGFELNPVSFLDGVHYCKAAEMKINIPTLFDMEEETQKEVVNG